MKFRFATLVITLTIIVLAIVTSLAAQNSTPQPGAANEPLPKKTCSIFVWIADPQVSPDGSRAVFTRVVTDEKHTGYETSIWMVATSGNEDPVRMTNGKHDVHPRWSPDGRRIAFARGGEKDDSGKPRPAQIAVSVAGWWRSPHHYRSAQGRYWSGLVAGWQAHRVHEFDHTRGYRERAAQEE